MNNHSHLLGLIPELQEMIVRDVVKVPYNGPRIHLTAGGHHPNQPELSLRIFFPPAVPGENTSVLPGGNPWVRLWRDWHRSRQILEVFWGTDAALMNTARRLFFRENTFILQQPLLEGLRRSVRGLPVPRDDRLQALRPHLQKIRHLRFQTYTPLPFLCNWTTGAQQTSGFNLGQTLMIHLTDVLRLFPDLRSLEICLYGRVNQQFNQLRQARPPAGVLPRTPAQITALLNTELDGWYSGVINGPPHANPFLPIAMAPHLTVTIRNNRQCNMMQRFAMSHELALEYAGATYYEKVDGRNMTQVQQKAALLAGPYRELLLA